MKFSALNVALAAAFIPVCAFAQEQITSLEPIVVTASRTAVPLSKVLGDVSVITQEELQREPSPNLLNVLARKPGLQVYNSGGPQTVSGLFIRGAAPAQSLIMLNGIRISDANMGSTYWNVIDPALLNRVEVVRGSASGLYGSNAMGGVVNLLTTPSEVGARDLSLRANIGFGSHGLVRTNIGLSGATEKLDYYIAGGYASSSGFNATNPDAGPWTYNNDKDGYDQAAIVGSFGYTFAPGHRLGISFFDAVNRGEFDSGPVPAFTYGYTRQKGIAINSTNQFTDWWQSVMQVAYNKITYDARATFPSLFNTRTTLYSWQNNFTLTPEQVLSLVYEHTDERVYTQSGINRDQRYTDSVALLYKGDFGAHHLQANLRRDNVSDTINSTTGGLSYAFDITPELQVGAGFNTGFRTPTFADMYTPLSWGYQGNPNLHPEKSRNVELSLRYSNETTQAGITVFQNKYKDLINGYVCDAMFNCTAQNINKATIRGLSLDASHRFGNTTVSLGADFLNAKDDTTGKRLIRRANQVYRAGISHEFERVTVGADYLFVGHRYDDTANTKAKRLGGYGLVNLRADFKASKSFQIQASVNNVFNKKYSPAYGYNGEGTNFFVNLTYQH